MSHFAVSEYFAVGPLAGVLVANDPVDNSDNKLVDDDFVVDAVVASEVGVVVPREVFQSVEQVQFLAQARDRHLGQL